MKSIHSFLGIALFTAIWNQVQAQKFQQVLQSEITESNPGILFTVESGDESFSWSGAAGINDRALGDSLQIEETFRIASVTKTYVTAGILRLMEKSILKLEDPISKHISQEHTKILSQDYDLDKITIRQILRHSAGFFDHTNAPEFFETVVNAPDHEWTRTEQLQMGVEKGDPIGPLGKQFSYSDTGYVILGELIEKYTGKSLDSGLKELLRIEALGLNRTDFERMDAETDQLRIHQYFQGRDTYQFSPTMDYYGGGGILSTTQELVDFFQALFQGKVFEKAETLEIMLEPVTYETKARMDYQMGMYKIKVNGLEAFSHSGFWGTQVIYIPELNLYMSANYSGGWRGSAVAPIFEKILLEMGKSSE
ncbi:D-alanyl-D-alanine carboxypeptidase [Algoriphagus alkaliphilus]|uniref:D-alanyl-D-alanine carboxypeptidase n=1 Tax=Algoriphagus alkaliphilus TaxID=279824 RepID=A0A1G5ZHT3_9BACT|nr:serine hydrolase domain-containing protein [Algoriphagus alkaliphilus]SDA94155.1 D-alanyl-D-alanine carboxypeptidase [Algoriphagus alkaliphilus]